MKILRKIKIPRAYFKPFKVITCRTSGHSWTHLEGLYKGELKGRWCKRCGKEDGQRIGEEYSWWIDIDEELFERRRQRQAMMIVYTIVMGGMAFDIFLIIQIIEAIWQHTPVM